MIVVSFGCNNSETPISIDRKIYSPDSSYVIIGYYYDYGALGKSPDQLSIIEKCEKIPKSGNIIEDKYAPRMEWISNDSILVLCGPNVESIREWAKPKFRDIKLIYRNDNPPFGLNKKIFFSDYELIEDSIIVFKTGIKHFIYYLDWNEEYRLPRNSLKIVKSNNEFEKIIINKKIVLSETEEVAEGRYLTVKYIPEYDLIPSSISDDKLKKLESIVKSRI